jgi:hypothetical protein
MRRRLARETSRRPAIIFLLRRRSGRLAAALSNCWPRLMSHFVLLALGRTLECLRGDQFLRPPDDVETMMGQRRCSLVSVCLSGWWLKAACWGRRRRGMKPASGAGAFNAKRDSLWREMADTRLRCDEISHWQRTRSGAAGRTPVATLQGGALGCECVCVSRPPGRSNDNCGRPGPCPWRALIIVLSGPPLWWSVAPKSPTRHLSLAVVRRPVRAFEAATAAGSQTTDSDELSRWQMDCERAGSALTADAPVHRL